MNRSFRWASICAGILWLAGCSSEKKGGAVTLMGQVLHRISEVSTAPAANAVVTVRGDFNADGTIAANESSTASADESGRYLLTLQLKSRTELLVSFRAQDGLANFRRVVASPPVVLRLDAVTHSGEALTAKASWLKLENNKLRLGGLPAGTTGTARVFNPLLEPEAFPGEFADDQGTRIVSAAFTKVELQTDAGEPIHQLSSPATLEMDVPRDTWGILRDMLPGNDRIEVPRYWFDEEVGRWKNEGMGYLVTGNGEVVPETALAALHDGSLTGNVMARYEVTHLSTINVDFPTCGGASGPPPLMKTHLPLDEPSNPPGCSNSNSVKCKPKVKESTGSSIKDWINCTLNLGSCKKPDAPEPSSQFGPGKRKTLKDFNPKPKGVPLAPRGAGSEDVLVPVTGATVLARFYYQDGTFLGYVTAEVDPDGSVEIPIGVSEPDGQDLDGNGKAGEKVFVVATIDWYGYHFHLIEGEVPSQENLVYDLGDVDIVEGYLGGTRCDISGTVEYLDGTPAEGAVVFLESQTNLSETELVAKCGSEYENCTWDGVADANGNFHLAAPFSDALSIQGFVEKRSGPTYTSVYGIWNGRDCPTGPLRIRMSYGEEQTTVVPSVTGSSITWEPALPLELLAVYGTEGEEKWILRAASASLQPPIIYGTVPAGARQEMAAQGSLGSGDLIWLEGKDTSAMGYPVEISGEAIVP